MARLKNSDLSEETTRWELKYLICASILALAILVAFIYLRPWWLGLILGISFFGFAYCFGGMLSAYQRMNAALIAAATEAIMKK